MKKIKRLIEFNKEYFIKPLKDYYKFLQNNTLGDALFISIMMALISGWFVIPIYIIYYPFEIIAIIIDGPYLHKPLFK